MEERESIFTWLTAAYWDIPMVSLVTRFDHRAIIGSLNEFPAICIVDLGDQFLSKDSYRGVTNDLMISVVSVYEGTTEDTAGSELAEFEKSVKKQTYSVLNHDLVMDLTPHGISPVRYRDVGSRVVVQGLEFKIMYFEDVRKLASVLPTL